MSQCAIKIMAQLKISLQEDCLCVFTKEKTFGMSIQLSTEKEQDVQLV